MEQSQLEIWKFSKVLVSSVHYGSFDYLLHSNSYSSFLLESSYLIEQGRIVLLKDLTQPLDFTRSKIAQYVTNNEDEFTHLFFYDTDMSISLEHITMLLNRKVNVVSGTYFMGCTKVRDDGTELLFPCVSSKNHEYITRDEIKANKGNLIEVDSVGCGCLLVTVEHLRKLGFPTFKHNWILQGGLKILELEDGYFSRLTKSIGEKLYIDTNVLPLHYKMFQIGYNIFDFNSKKFIDNSTGDIIKCH